MVDNWMTGQPAVFMRWSACLVAAFAAGPVDMRSPSSAAQGGGGKGGMPRRAAESAASPLQERPILSFITPAWKDDQAAWLSQVRESARGGANMVQIRDKEATSEVLCGVGKAVVEAVAGTDCLVLLNGQDVEAVLACGAHGMHVPERGLEDIPRYTSRLREGPRGGGGGSSFALVGVSVHSVASAIRAARLGASYIQVGTMFPTASHPEKGMAVEGPGLMTQVARALEEHGLRRRVALVGVGGIEETNAVKVVEAGADGVAVIGALAKAADPAAAARRILAAMSSASSSSSSSSSPS